MTLRFAGYTPPSGYTVAKAELRASYDSNDSCTLLRFGCSGTPSASLRLVGLPERVHERSRTSRSAATSRPRSTT